MQYQYRNLDYAVPFYCRKDFVINTVIVLFKIKDSKRNKNSGKINKQKSNTCINDCILTVNLVILATGTLIAHNQKPSSTV